MLKVSEYWSELGVLDIMPMRDQYPNRISLRDGSINIESPDGMTYLWKDLGYTIISVKIDEYQTCDTCVTQPITNEKIEQAVASVKALYAAKTMPLSYIALRSINQYTLPTGTISMSDVNIELGQAWNTNISLNQADVRQLAQKPSGTISMADLRGKSRDFWVNAGAGRWENAEITWWIPSTIAYINATIHYPSGAALHATSTSTYAIHVRWSAAQNIILEFASGSRCVGRGGNGGGGSSTGGGGGGGAGGPAVYREQNLVMTLHSGCIVGGGGGGGGGGGSKKYASSSKIATYDYWSGGGGGGGGYGGGAGGAAGGCAGASITAWAGGGGAGGDTWAGGGGGGGQVTFASGKTGALYGVGGAGGSGGGINSWGGGGGASGGNGGASTGPGGGGGPGWNGWSDLTPVIALRNSLIGVSNAYEYENDNGDRIVISLKGPNGKPGELVVGDIGSFKIVMK